MDADGAEARGAQRSEHRRVVGERARALAALSGSGTALPQPSLPPLFRHCRCRGLRCGNRCRCRFTADAAVAVH